MTTLLSFFLYNLCALSCLSFLSLISLCACSTIAFLSLAFLACDFKFLISSREIPTMALATLTFLFLFLLAYSSVLIFLLCLLQAYVQVIFLGLNFSDRETSGFFTLIDKPSTIFPYKCDSFSGIDFMLRKSINVSSYNHFQDFVSFLILSV